MTSAVLLCAGKSSRFSKGLMNKTLYKLNGKPLFMYSLEAFEDWGVDEVILVVRKQERNIFEKFTASFSNIKISFGGERRQDSVMNALNIISAEEHVLIHDGARPMLSSELIERVAGLISEKRCVVPVIPSDDTLRIEENGKLVTLDRSRIFRMQTPQGCIAGELKALYKRFYDVYFYDDAAAFEKAGLEVFPVEGDRKNIKITTQDEIKLWNVRNHE